MSEPGYLIPAYLLIGDAWPRDVFELLDDSILSRIGLASLEFRRPAQAYARVVLRTDSEIRLPGLALVSIRIGRAEAELGTSFDVAVTLEPPATLSLQAPVGLVLSRPAFQPVRSEGGRFVIDENPATRVELSLDGTVIADLSGRFELGTSGDILVTPFMLDQTGIVVELEGLRLHFGDTQSPPVGRPEGWQGIEIGRAAIHLPDDVEIPLPTTFAFENCTIGGGGFSGTAEALWEEVSPGELLGMEFASGRIALTFEESAIVEAVLAGDLMLPFFDRWLGVEARFDLGGDFSVALCASRRLAEGEAETDEGATETRDGLLTFTRPDLVTVKAESLAFEKRAEVWFVQLGGRLRPLLAGLDWPEFDIKELSISSHGDVEIDGGWIDVSRGVTLDFYGFQIGITQAGFGTEQEGARQWLGVSGSINLVEGLPLSASVEGLKFSWNREGEPDLDITLRGIGVHLEIPNVLTLDGSVAYEELADSEDGLSGHIFRGHVNVDLPPLKTELAGELIVGRLENVAGEEFTAFYILLDADLPTPIPLGSTGTAIHSLRGLYGAHIAPDRHLIEGAPEPWYEWYKAERGEGTAYSVTSTRKWAPRFDHYGFGAGLALGTQFDDGYSLNVKALAAVLLPGPVVMIEGRANLLAPRSADRQASGAFCALAVFDGLASTFQVNVDVMYSLAPVIEASGGLEAFFDFTDPGRWHLHLGKKDPDSKRIQAQILALFTANAYLMIDNRGLETGAFIGFDWRASLGPVSLSLVARITFDAGIFWKPLQLEGTLALYGEVALKAFGIGISLVIEALLEGRAPAPYRVHGMFRVGLSLPWPLPDVKAKVELEWTEPDTPRPVQPFLKVAALAHHKRTGAGWSLEAGDATAPPAEYTVVPVDIRPVLSFARPIYGLSRRRSDDGVLLPVEKDRVGDYEFSYALENVVLEAYDPERDLWDVVRRGVSEAGGGGGFVVDDESFASGRDAQEPQLELWRHATLDRSTVYWRESYPDWHSPCPARVVAPEHCVDWRYVPNDTGYPREFRHQGLRFIADAVDPALDWAEPKVSGGGLLAPAIIVRLPEPAGWLEIQVAPWQGSEARMTAYGEGRRVGEWVSVAGVLRYSGAVPVDSFRLVSDRYPLGAVAVRSICYRTARELWDERATMPPTDAGASTTPALASRTLVLDPDRRYRLTIQTTTEGGPGSTGPTAGEGVFYFRTDKGPGTAPVTAVHADTPLNDLGTYVARTLPAHGARTFYYGYDLGIEFNESYVELLYKAPLRIRLRDRNGRIIGDPEGAWETGSLPLLTPGLLTWLWAEESGGCGGRTDPPPHGAYVHRPPPSQLAPNRLYTVEVVTDGWESPDRPLYTFQFTTSRYRTAAEHLASGRSGESPGEQVVRVLPPGPRPPMDWVSGHRDGVAELGETRRGLDSAITAGDANLVAEELAAVRKATDALDEMSAAIFERPDRGDEGGYPGVHERFVAVDLRHRPLPPALEFVQLNIEGSGDKFLMLESPEPLDWDRMTVSCLDALGRIPIRVVWNGDRTRAFVFRDDDAWLTSGRYTFEFVYSGGQNPERGLITRSGVAVEEHVECVVHLR